MKNYQKSDGFTGQKSIVLPNDFLNTVSSHPLVSPIYITDIGFFPDARYHYIDRKSGCARHILIFCAGGKGFVILNGRKRQITANDVLIIKKGTPHIYGSDENDPWNIFWVHFDGESADCFLEKNNDTNPVLTVSIDKASKLRILFCEIIDAIATGYSLDNSVYTSQVFANLLGTLFFKSNSLSTPEDETPIEKVMQFMLLHMDRNLKLSELADMVHLSPTYFSFLFKQKTGFSPIDYFLRLKIQCACQYLDTTGLKIITIAKRLGFSDPYYFSRVFSKIMGQSPTEYKSMPKG